MKEKEILKQTYRSEKPLISTEKPKKKYYKPKKKKEEEITQIENAEKPYVAALEGIKIPKTVGSYCIGSKKGFCIHLEKRPSWLHRKCMKLFLGWTWSDSKNK